jgi:hypothetical protein
VGAGPMGGLDCDGTGDRVNIWESFACAIPESILDGAGKCTGGPFASRILKVYFSLSGGFPFRPGSESGLW